jgi:type IV secretory pathway VirB2 component (pilin)
MKRLPTILFLVVLVVFCYVNVVSAQVPLDQKIEEIYSNIVTFVAGPLAILFLIYAGYLYITSTGNPEQLGMAKEMIVSTITAIIILLLAGLILNTIGESPTAGPADLNSGSDGQQEEQQTEDDQAGEDGQNGQEDNPGEDQDISGENPGDDGLVEREARYST